MKALCFTFDNAFSLRKLPKIQLHCLQGIFLVLEFKLNCHIYINVP